MTAIQERALAHVVEYGGYVSTRRVANKLDHDQVRLSVTNRKAYRVLRKLQDAGLVVSELWSGECRWSATDAGRLLHSQSQG